MKSIFSTLFLALLIPSLVESVLNIGVGKTDITPSVGTPSAGYRERKGEGMEGVHDFLLAIALFIDNGEKQVVLCSVDHLGFTYEMYQEIIRQVHALPTLKNCEIYIASSHTHAGGGAYLNIPILGDMLAGKYNKETTDFYNSRTVEAITQAFHNAVPGKIGIGYGEAKSLSNYRSTYPENISPIPDVAVIKITKLDNTPLAVFFNFAIHPTVLKSQNRLFSADFVGYARDHLKTLIGSDVQPLFFNGAQGDIAPVITNDSDRFVSCGDIGKSLGDTVKDIWDKIAVSEALNIDSSKIPYVLKPESTPFGLSLPIEGYSSEMNVIILNKLHAFITIPGELSTLYDRNLKKFGKKLGYNHISIFGLTNDAHGYIISPESWRHKTFESGLSFGGEHYGGQTEIRAKELLEKWAPR